MVSAKDQPRERTFDQSRAIAEVRNEGSLPTEAQFRVAHAEARLPRACAIVCAGECNGRLHHAFTCGGIIY